MKIAIVPYNPEWSAQFRQIADELKVILKDVHPTIEHMGSTSVSGLAAKPIIDVAVGIASTALLDKTIAPMTGHNYIYFEKYNSVMPLRRHYVGLQSGAPIHRFQSVYTEADKVPHEDIYPHKRVHVHVWELGSPEYLRHIAFRDYLRAHPEIVRQYAQLKKQLSVQEWEDGNAYNSGKNDFIKQEEAKAIVWYKATAKSRSIKNGE